MGNTAYNFYGNTLASNTENMQNANACYLSCSDHKADSELCAQLSGNFGALLNDMDFKTELKIFNLSFFELTLKRVILQELNMTYIALWALALKQSFPQNAIQFFTCFVDSYVQQFKSTAQKKYREKIFAYKDMVLRTDAKDFNHISEHLLSYAKQNIKNNKADTLRLALALRNHYSFIFQRLV